MKNIDFDQVVNRWNTDCLKFDDSVNRFGTSDVYPMWVADMDFKAPGIVQKAFEKIVSEGVYGYHLRTAKYEGAVVDWHRRRHQFLFDEKAVTFTPGVVPAISYLIQAFTQPGDGIIVQPPVYYPFFSVVKQNHRNLLENKLIDDGNRFAIDFDDFEEKAKKAKMFIFCSPHNPVGRVWSKVELDKLAAICLKYNLIVVSDEIHSDLVLGNNKHISFATLSPEVAARTITCHSPSKTFNLAGLSTAYVIITNPKLQQTFKEYYSTLYAEGLNIFGYTSLLLAYTEGEPWLKELLQYIQKNFSVLQNTLQTKIPNVKLYEPEAMYLAWLDFRKLGLDNASLKKFIIEKAKLGLNDGPTFGAGGEGFQRMNLACPTSVLVKSLSQLEDAIKS